MTLHDERPRLSEPTPSLPMTDLVINGRFLHLDHNGGYQRYAAEMTRHLHARVAQPPDAWARGPRGRVWEQTRLLAAARDQVLLSPANSGPMGHPGHILVLHDLFPLSHPEWFTPRYVRWQRLLLPRLAHDAAALVAPSHRVATEIHDRFDVPIERIHVVPPGVGPPIGPAHLERREVYVNHIRRQLGLTPDTPFVFGLVSGVVRKNSGQLLAVLSRLVERNPGVVAGVAGLHDPTRVVLSTDRLVDDTVTDLGPVGDGYLAELYRMADVFVWLPHAEGFGMPVLEAAVSGPAVVTTPVPAATEIVGPALGDRCAVVAPDDLPAAVEAVEERLEARHPDPATLADLTARNAWSERAAAMASIADSVARELHR